MEPTLKFNDVYEYLDSLNKDDFINNETAYYVMDELIDINFDNLYFIKKFIQKRKSKDFLPNLCLHKLGIMML